MKLCYLGLQVRKKNIKKGHKGLDGPKTPPFLLDDQQPLHPFSISFFSISPLPSSLTQVSLRLPPLGFLRRRATAVAIVTPLSDQPFIIFPCLDFRSRNESRFDRRSRPRVLLLRLVFLVSMVRLDALYFY